MDETHVFWITTRAAGLIALVAASLAVTLGLLMANGALRGHKPAARVTHEALSIATIAAIVLHAGALLLDGYISPSLADITIPFVSDYRPVWTSMGIVAGWMLLALGLSYYARGRIGAARWRRLHRWTALAWVLAVVHGLMEGTDSGAAWFLLTCLAAVLPAAGLLMARLAEDPQPA